MCNVDNLSSFHDITPALLSILTEHVNAYGKVDDAEICKTIAAYINMLPEGCYYGSSLFDFIYEYGEDEDMTFIGRDADGEKQYHSFNPDTNWHERIRKELVALGYYKRFDMRTVAEKREAA